MSKYYAVKHGRIPGIYKTWSECRRQTDGFSGAVFKSFKTESDAKVFCGHSPEPDSSMLSDVLEIFTDGSHEKSGTNMGYGIMFRYMGQEFGVSRHPVTAEDLEIMFGGTFKTVSNPTMEFAAVAHALHLANVKFKRPKNICITYDYIGPVNWITGTWSCKQPHIKHIHKFALAEIQNLDDTVITWKHVKSHSGHRENNIADSLAAGVWHRDLLSL